MLLGVYLYSRVQPSEGYLQAHKVGSPPVGEHGLSLRTWLASTALARQVMRFQMRDGSAINSRIVDAGALLSVHMDSDYDIPGVAWSAARTIVDIGAHVGCFTVWAARRAPHARLLAVEPNPETFQLLVQNIRSNGLEDRVVAINAAVGVEAGTAQLDFVAHSLGTRIAVSAGDGVRVRVQTLGGLLAEASVSQIEMLKMDCEGMEYSILPTLGMKGLDVIGALACEYHPEPGHNPSELDAILLSAGFRVRRPDAPLGVLWATR